MNRAEADRIIEKHVRLLRSRTYDDLRGLLGASQNQEVVGPSGVSYQLETQAFWDDQPNGNLRVLVSVDDGGLRAFVPLTADFILSSAGAFVGE